MPSGLGNSTLGDVCVSFVTVADTTHHSSKPPSRGRATLDRFFLDAMCLTFPLRDAYSKITLAELLCSNHVKYHFGRDMMPKAYRLSPNSMAIITDYYSR